MKLRFSFGWKKSAGLITIWTEPKIDWHTSWTFHLFIQPSSWVWGKKEDWFDGPLIDYGFGPLFLICKTW